MEVELRAWGVVFLAAVLALPLAAIICVRLATARRARDDSRRRAWVTAAMDVGMVLGTVPWVWLLLMPHPGEDRLLLGPGRWVGELLGGEPGVAAVRVAEALLVFAAVGFLAPIRWPVRPLTVAAAAAGVATALTLLQYALPLGRVSSLDQIMLATLGAVIAAILASQFRSPAAASAP